MGNTHTNKQPNDLLRRERLLRGWTQRDIGDQVGTDSYTVNRWERGRAVPSSYFRVKLCALFGKSVAELGLVSDKVLSSHKAIEASTRTPIEAPAPALSHPWMIPFLRNSYFTGREDMLATLHAHLYGSQLVALTGLGGIGKTQLALEYAYRYASEYRAVFWIGAESLEQILSSLVRIANLLQLPESQDANQQRCVQAVQRWLSVSQQWLLIWDNLEDLQHLYRFLPSGQQGATLITTRTQTLGTLVCGMDVPSMEEDEGTLFILRRAKLLAPDAALEQVQQVRGNLPTEFTAAQDLVKELEGLPLALDQAGAYIEETSCSLSNYLHYYQEQRAHLLSRRGSLGWEHPHSVSVTFTLTKEQLERACPAAADLLRMCAFLHAESIPEELFIGVPTPLNDPVIVTASQFDLMMAALRIFSLVQRHPETQTFSLHRLVQVVLQEEMSQQECTQWQQQAIQRLAIIFPEPTPEAWKQCSRLLPHVLTCTATISSHLYDSQLAEMLRKAGDYLYQRTQYKQAEALFERALSIQEQTPGPEHIQTATTLHSLALLYREQGKYEQAELLFKRALDVQEQALGPEHPDIARPLTSLATMYTEQGNYRQAEPLFKRALDIRKQALGPEHPDVAHPLSGLATMYIEQGNYRQAEPLFRQALQIWKQALGPRHYLVAFPINNLAEIYREQGEYEQAKQQYEQALRIWEQALGPEHINVAHALHGLAELWWKQGAYEHAEKLFAHALHIREQQLLSLHPLIARTLHAMATMYKDQGRYEQAKPLFQRALCIWEQTFGPEHPKTITVRDQLAYLSHQLEQMPIFVSSQNVEVQIDHLQQHPTCHSI